MKKSIFLSLLTSCSIVLSISSCVGLNLQLPKLNGVPFTQMQVDNSNINNGVGSFSSPFGNGNLSYASDMVNLYLTDSSSLSGAWPFYAYNSTIGSIQQVAPSFLTSSILVLNKQGNLFSCTNYMSLGCTAYTMPAPVSGTVSAIAGNDNIQYVATSPFNIYGSSGVNNYALISATLVASLISQNIITAASDISVVSMQATKDGNLIFIFSTANSFGQSIYYATYSSASLSWTNIGILPTANNMVYASDGSIFFIRSTQPILVCDNINNIIQFKVGVIKSGSITPLEATSIAKVNCDNMRMLRFNTINIDLNNNVYIGIGNDDSNLTNNNLGIFYSNSTGLLAAAK